MASSSSGNKPAWLDGDLWWYHMVQSLKY
uniref:Uncharacterized protein n=1 Tax=Nelumbo nucifera TaxID=4432 RepID=A0A822ZJC4_NELNU|nr:TPA_asm: hypothetical protein HUJ06_003462 [Nelumbo nucifera]